MLKTDNLQLHSSLSFVSFCFSLFKPVYFCFIFYDKKVSHTQKALMSKKTTNKTKISAQFCIKPWKLLRRWKSFVLRWVLFCTREIFLCKNKQVWNCLDNLNSLYYSILLPSTPPPSFYYTHIFWNNLWEWIFSFLWESFWTSIICVDLFFFLNLYRHSFFESIHRHSHFWFDSVITDLKRK